MDKFVRVKLSQRHTLLHTDRKFDNTYPKMLKGTVPEPTYLNLIEEINAGNDLAAKKGDRMMLVMLCLLVACFGSATILFVFTLAEPNLESAIMMLVFIGLGIATRRWRTKVDERNYEQTVRPLVEGLQAELPDGVTIEWVSEERPICQTNASLCSEETYTQYYLEIVLRSHVVAAHHDQFVDENPAANLLHASRATTPVPPGGIHIINKPKETAGDVSPQVTEILCVQCGQRFVSGMNHCPFCGVSLYRIEPASVIAEKQAAAEEAKAAKAKKEAHHAV